MEDLEKHVKELKKEIEVLKSKMTELAEFATPANYNEELAEEYYSVLRLMNEKRNELNVLLNNQPKNIKMILETSNKKYAGLYRVNTRLLALNQSA